MDDRPIWDIWLSSNILPAVCAADELGLLAALQRQPAGLGELCAALELAERPVEALLAVLGGLSLVRHFEGKFFVTELARSYLLKDSHFYWGWMLGPQNPRVKELVDIIRGTNAGGQERWEAMRHGQMSPERAESIARSMQSHSFPAALGLARIVDFSGTRRLLDVAGGSGCYAIALALQHPELRCTLADLPLVCEQAKQYIRRYGAEDRVDTLAFNMFDDDWPAGYDAIFFSNAFHDWDAAERHMLASRAFAALPSGGRIHLHEMLLSDAKDGPLTAALFSLLMLTGTRGKQFSAPELRQLLASAGFRDMTVQPAYGYYSLVTAVKP